MLSYFPKEYHLDALHWYATRVRVPNVQLTVGDNEQLMARIAIDAIKLGATVTEIKEALGLRKPTNACTMHTPGVWWIDTPGFRLLLLK